MNWDAVGAIAEALGAIGVIATLGYLAIQISANTAAMRAEARRTNVGQSALSAVTFGSSKEATSVLRRGLGDPGVLDPDEHVQFWMLLGAIVSHSASSFEELELGIIDRASFESTSTQALRMLKTPGGRDFWSTFGATYPAGFQAHVDREFL